MKLKEENKNKTVLTTSHILCNGSLVTYVLYDEDGDWQLFGDEEFDENEDAYLLSVEEIIEMEPNLRKLPDLKMGQAAFWDKDRSRWFVAEE